MDNDLIVKNFQRVNENFMEAAAANQDIHRILKRYGRKIRGLRGAVFGLTLVAGFLISRLAERKRSENYLSEQIEELNEKTEELEERTKNLSSKVFQIELETRDFNCDGGDHDA